MPRVSYNRTYPIEIDYDENGEVSRQIVYRMQVERGERVRFCISLQVRDDADGRLKDIVRYDDFGGFHRHSPGFPPGNDHHWLREVPPQNQFEYAASDLLERADLYESIARETGYEVGEESENEEDTE